MTLAERADNIMRALGDYWSPHDRVRVVVKIVDELDTAVSEALAARDTEIAGLMRALDELAERAAAAEAARPRWIQVTERTPTRSEIHGSSPDVLAQTDDGDIVVAFVFVLDGALIWSSGHTRHRVVAWQPLPERWTP